MTDIRPGETHLEFDPATLPGDGHVIFIGRIESPWKDRADCPRNLIQARERGLPARLVIDAPWRAGLQGLEGASHVVILSWLDRSARNVIVQKPRHTPASKGVFALRSPARPNPVGLHVVRVIGLDRDAGILELDAIDVLDGTPVIDLKPYLPSIDSVPDAVAGRAGSDAP